MHKKPLYSLGLISLLVLSMFVSTSSVYAGWGDYTQNSAITQSINTLGNDPVLNLPIPILFGVEQRNLTRNFGEPRAGHAHEGLDIMAPEGTPIVSPTNAVVLKVGFYSGAGNFVTTANPGNEFFSYMHLSKIADIKEGDALKPGDLIGYVGYTGNAIATAPHLHFEIRDPNDVPKDPFPRITTTFDLNNKITYLQTILNKSTNPTELANFLITKFGSTFISAKTLGIVLPNQIEASMSKIATPVVTTSISTTSTATLRVGSSGSAVVTLQKYLVSKNVGSAYKVKPDGAFGPITKQALIDYQRSVGLGADGVYGPLSRAYVVAHL